MSILSCSTPDCHKPVHVKKRGLCRLHYSRWYQSEGAAIATPHAERLRLRPAFTCESCGKFHPEQEVSGKGRIARRYCDRDCNNAKFTRAERARRLSTRGTRFCLACNEDISAKKLDAKYCSKFCTDVSRGVRLADPLAEITCALEGCEVVFRPKTRRQKCCSENHGAIHCNRKGRAAGRYAKSPWNDARKASYHKRRALKQNLPADNIRPADVYERDDWVCSLCALPVDRNTAWPDPMSPSLDHVQPLSLGGHHTMENVALAHLSCNIRKGNRVEVAI